jgi:SapC
MSLMAKLVAVDRERHAGKGWRQPTGYGFAATQAVIPLMGAEFAKAALAMPIAFIEQAGR